MAGAYLSECFKSVMLGSVCIGLFLVGAKLRPSLETCGLLCPICYCLSYLCVSGEMLNYVLNESYTGGADKSLARPGKKRATFPAFYGTWRFITLFTRVHHLFLTLAKSIHSSAHHTFDRHILFPS